LILALQFYQPMPCMIWAAIIVELALSIKFGANWPDFAVLMGLQFINGTLSLCVPFPLALALLDVWLLLRAWAARAAQLRCSAATAAAHRE